MTAMSDRRNYDEGVAKTLRPYPQRTLLDYLRENAAQWPSRPALLFKGATTGYGQLEKSSTRLAAGLVSLGVKPRDRVAIVLPNCPQFIIAELAAWKAGAIACPINPTYTDRELEMALNATGAETVVVLNRFYEKVKEIQPRTSVKRVIATGIKDSLPTLKRIAYTLLKEKKDGERIDLAKGDWLLGRLLTRHALSPAPQVKISPKDAAVIPVSYTHLR